MARPLPPRKVPRKRGTTNRKAPSSQRVANQPSGEGEHLLAFDDRIVPLVFQSNKRARRIIIRLDHFHARVVVVLPSRATRDQGRRFALLSHELAGRAHRLHLDGLMLRGIAHHDTELTTLASIDRYLGDHSRHVQIQAIRLGAVHNAEAAALLGDALLFDDLRNVIHVSLTLRSM